MKYEIFNKKLYQTIKEKTEEYYAGTRNRSSFKNEIKADLAKHNLFFEFDIVHQCKGKNQVELHKQIYIPIGRVKKRADDIYVIYNQDEIRQSVKSKQVDPESAYRVMQEVSNDSEEW